MTQLLILTTTQKFPPQDKAGIAHTGSVKSVDEAVWHTSTTTCQGWKFMILSHCQELGHFVPLASDWLFTLLQLIGSHYFLVETTLDNAYKS